MIRVEAQITACQCICEHCCVCGQSSKSNMSTAEIENILRNMKEYSKDGFFFPLFDITNHPDFIDILKMSNNFGFPRNVISTNGIYEFTRNEFSALREVGITELQLAFHGIGKTHDNFVHVNGAYDKMMSLITKAKEFGFGLWILLFINRENADDIQRLSQVLTDMAFFKNKDFGIVTYQYQGRVILRNKLLFTRHEFDELSCKDDIVIPMHTEKDWLDIVKQGEWDKPVFSYQKDDIGIYIDNNFDVFFRPYNPYYFPGLPNAKKGFGLGNLRDESLSSIIERADHKRPAYIQMLENVSASQLADIVGREDDVLYELHDVPLYKWPYEFLKSKASSV